MLRLLINTTGHKRVIVITITRGQQIQVSDNDSNRSDYLGEFTPGQEDHKPDRAAMLTFSIA